MSEANNAVNLVQETGAANIPADTLSCFKLTGVGTTNKFGLFQPIEPEVAKLYAGKKASFQFAARNHGLGNITLVRAALLYWAAPGVVDQIARDPVSVWGDESTNPTLVTGWNYVATPVALTALTSSWATFKFEGLSVPSGALNLGIFIWVQDKTYSALSDGIYLGRVGLNLGNSCGRYAYGSLGRELPRCERYFAKTFDYSIAPKNFNGSGGDELRGILRGGSSFNGNGPKEPNQVLIEWRFPQTMRTLPTLVPYSPYNDGVAGQFRQVSTGSTSSLFTPSKISRERCWFECAGYLHSNSGVMYHGHATADARL